MDSKYKYSKYNIINEVNEGKVVYNTLSGICSLLEEEDLKIFDNIETKKLDNMTPIEIDILDNLLLNNFIVPKDIDETVVFEEKYNSMRNNQENLIMTVVPTLNCNFECNYCFQGKLKDNKVMSEEVQDGIFQLIQNYSNNLRNVSLTWFGGEPTIAMNVVRRLSDKIIPYCDKNGINYTSMIVSNGYTCTPELMGELYARRVKTVQITLDGAKEVHDSIRYLKGSKKGSFDKIISNIRSYTDIYPIFTTIRVNVDQNNYKSIYRLIDQLADSGLSNKNVSIYFAPIISSNSLCHHISNQTLELSDFAGIESELRRYAHSKGLCGTSLPMQYMGLCGATRPKGFVVTPVGNIHKCWETVSYLDKSVGNVLSTPPLNENVKLWDEWSPFNYEECRNCIILPNCVGFCPYKFLYHSEFMGNSGNLPCPSLKYNINEKIMDHVKLKGLIKNEDL
ncbi:TIGR04463 family radical SAM/SPASM RiPP maturase [Methanococcus voltae]|uniref:Radical SAM domain protein n=1 Tax=Methanococcus voltae (strain ATCC BAA-1334 / A3) TaxID=456320 RepID=D7DT95_METV3|nr:TIGR04463 family radical SAM/SPASM RiPP maturase [Methanococcus voltae]MCS3901205.1 uncharacterized protein [Methanococcus voltae]